MASGESVGSINDCFFKVKDLTPINDFGLGGRANETHHQNSPGVIDANTANSLDSINTVASMGRVSPMSSTTGLDCTSPDQSAVRARTGSQVQPTTPDDNDAQVQSAPSIESTPLLESTTVNQSATQSESGSTSPGGFFSSLGSAVSQFGAKVQSFAPFPSFNAVNSYVQIPSAPDLQFASSLPSAHSDLYATPAQFDIQTEFAATRPSTTSSQYCSPPQMQYQLQNHNNAQAQYSSPLQVVWLNQNEMQGQYVYPLQPGVNPQSSTANQRSASYQHTSSFQSAATVNPAATQANQNQVVHGLDRFLKWASNCLPEAEHTALCQKFYDLIKKEGEKINDLLDSQILRPSHPNNPAALAASVDGRNSAAGQMPQALLESVADQMPEEFVDSAASQIPEAYVDSASDQMNEGLADEVADEIAETPPSSKLPETFFPMHEVEKYANLVRRALKQGWTIITFAGHIFTQRYLGKSGDDNQLAADRLTRDLHYALWVSNQRAIEQARLELLMIAQMAKQEKILAAQMAEWEKHIDTLKAEWQKATATQYIALQKNTAAQKAQNVVCQKNTAALQTLSERLAAADQAKAEKEASDKIRALKRAEEKLERKAADKIQAQAKRAEEKRICQEMMLAQEKVLALEKELASEKELAQQKMIAIEKALAREKELAQDKVLALEKELSLEKELAPKKKFFQENEITEEKKLAQKKKQAHKKALTQEKKRAAEAAKHQQDSQHRQTSPLQQVALQQNLTDVHAQNVHIQVSAADEELEQDRRARALYAGENGVQEVLAFQKAYRTTKKAKDAADNAARRAQIFADACVLDPELQQKPAMTAEEEADELTRMLDSIRAVAHYKGATPAEAEEHIAAYAAAAKAEGITLNAYLTRIDERKVKAQEDILQAKQDLEDEVVIGKMYYYAYKSWASKAGKDRDIIVKNWVINAVESDITLTEAWERLWVRPTAIAAAAKAKGEIYAWSSSSEYSQSPSPNRKRGRDEVNDTLAYKAPAAKVPRDDSDPVIAAKLHWARESLEQQRQAAQAAADDGGIVDDIF